MLDLFIEQEFLIDFYSDFSEETATEAQSVINRIFSEYTEMNVFIDIESEEELRQLLDLDPHIRQVSVYSPPNPVGNFDKYFSQARRVSRSALIFTKKEAVWKHKLLYRNFLFFNSDDYNTRIKSIIEKVHFFINFAEKENRSIKGWNDFKLFKNLPFSNVIISDNHAIVDTLSQKIENNLLPFLQNLLFDKKSAEITVTILTEKINNKNLSDTDRLEKIYRYLNSKLADYKVNLRFANSRIPTDIEFHDRYIYTDLSVMTSGKGINLNLYFKNEKQANIIVSNKTILDKDTYNTLKSHKKLIAKYIDKLNEIEVIKDTFKFYPGSFSIGL